jgi:hypothetical protein
MALNHSSFYANNTRLKINVAPSVATQIRPMMATSKPANEN